MSLTLFVFHLDISGNEFNDSQRENIPFILITLFVLNEDKSIFFKLSQFANKCLLIVHHYHLYQIYLNGILLMLKI